jgi:hypothetical protein
MLILSESNKEMKESLKKEFTSVSTSDVTSDTVPLEEAFDQDLLTQSVQVAKKV